jgi:predicted metal-binding protein
MVMEKQIGRITVDRNEASLPDDLKRYCQKALELGATKVKIISVEDIPVDERITLKCQIPRCFGYGAGAHCPPNTLKAAELRELLKGFRWAVFFIKDVPPEVIIRDKATIKERVDAYRDIYKIVTEMESMAFYDGHYLAFGFAAGSCRHTFCGKLETCQAMEGKQCRFPLLSRPSMEAVGIDVFHMVAKADWDIFPIGSNAKAVNMPKGTLAGIVIVQ